MGAQLARPVASVSAARSAVRSKTNTMTTGNQHRDMLRSVMVARRSAKKRVVLCRRPWGQEVIAIALTRQTGVTIIWNTMQRILSAAGRRPHSVRRRLHGLYPDFQPNVTHVCELHTAPLTDAIVLSVAEDPMQALRRRRPTRSDTSEVCHELEHRWRWDRRTIKDTGEEKSSREARPVLFSEPQGRKAAPFAASRSHLHLAHCKQSPDLPH
jgi:hypothetical protein